MNKKVLSGSLLGIGLVITIFVISAILVRSSASRVAKQFYAQYSHCLYSNEMSQCINGLKDEYPSVVSSLSPLDDLYNLPVNMRKFNLAVIYHHSLPILQNTHFIPSGIGGDEAHVILSGNLDWGDESLTKVQHNLLKKSLLATYPDFILSRPLSYRFDLVRAKKSWRINDVYYIPSSLGRKVSDYIVKCKNLLKANNKESALCTVSNGKVSLSPLVFNKAGFLATKDSADSDLETEIKIDPSEMAGLGSIEKNSLIIYVVDFGKLLSKDHLSNLEINRSTKRALLTPISKPRKTTSFCAVVAPLFKDGAFALYPTDFVSKDSTLIGKGGYLICSPAISWKKDNNLVWGIAGYLKNINSSDELSNPYLGFKLLLPPQTYYGTNLNAFGYDQKIGDNGQVFYRRAIPLKVINH